MIRHPAPLRRAVVAPAFLAASALLSAPAALACAFHDYVPRPALTDELAMSETVLLARPDAGAPFRFIPQEALRGGVQEVDLPYLVDSGTRRRLSANPEDHVLFIRPDDYGAWERSVYVDGDVRALLERLVAEIEREGYVSLERRVEIFGPLIESEHPVLQALALREADQLPYELMRLLPPPSDVGAQIAALRQPTAAQTHPIRLLLLGLSEDPAARAYLRAALVSAAGTGNTRNLGALAAAYVQSAGPEAVDEIARAFFEAPGGPRDGQAEPLIEALAIHGQQGDPATTAAIHHRVAGLLQSQPELLAPVARQFGGRADFTFADLAAGLLARGAVRSLEARNSAEEYVQRARRVASDAFLSD
ncbi:hypothetical protein PSA7680_02762 [Pseudoruegeria aquimaris]|uniref:Uncharacterized protein n=1 Tax=Pseudoruegeria aquimaris TaxID=393663 RepID=A0A1Y5T081_9RHOB|nr:hypothetical protein [Pseudoruegeria aquimaris]SLN52979.1 hypothetical protein PSA7680_02762 [Pseudoruegeria aquimaris]